MFLSEFFEFITTPPNLFFTIPVVALLVVQVIISVFRFIKG